jgi:hypothetical protein
MIDVLLDVLLLGMLLAIDLAFGRTDVRSALSS